jgi:chromate reductase, NAD(P)H dehydrogenase (quinone)
MTASPAFTGGVRAQQQMNETFVSIPARLVHRPQIVIGGVQRSLRPADVRVRRVNSTPGESLT